MTNDTSKNLLEALDIQSLDPQDQEEVLLTLNDLIFRSALVRLIERMDDKARDQFAALIARDATEEELTAFLRTAVPTADEVVGEALDELTDDIIAVTQ